MTTASVQAGEHAFEQALARETLKSERLRAGIVALLVGGLFLRWVGIWLFFPGAIEEQRASKLRRGGARRTSAGAP